MSETFLEKILKSTRQKLKLQRENTDLAAIRERAFELRKGRYKYRFSQALSDADKANIIAEIKRASPSKGIINDTVDVEETARMYKAGGACAISVLTEETF